MNKFLEETLEGLSKTPKQLYSKYFYDEAGDKIFQDIMASEEYYLTNCEMEIFTEQTPALAHTLRNGFVDFDLIELGAGDATKSSFLLKELLAQKANFTYYPIDISSNVIKNLEENLPKSIPGLKVKGLNGEYFDMLKKAYQLSEKRKVVLFMGANIGNMPIKEAEKFCQHLRENLAQDDLLLIGFDLKKHPRIIRAAYNDKDGNTKAFNFNLLKRMNKELDANFDLQAFEHYPSYDPENGSCKSYLISLKHQRVQIGKTNYIDFEENEHIFMEISQKYSVSEAEKLATGANFIVEESFFDQKKWFMDSVWKCV